MENNSDNFLIMKKLGLLSSKVKKSHSYILEKKKSAPINIKKKCENYICEKLDENTTAKENSEVSVEDIRDEMSKYIDENKLMKIGGMEELTEFNPMLTTKSKFKKITKIKYKEKYLKEKEEITKFLEGKSLINESFMNSLNSMNMKSFENINMFLPKSKVNSSTLDANMDLKSKIKLHIDKVVYRDPLESLSILHKNHYIYNKIINGFSSNEIKSYKRSISNLNPILKKKIEFNTNKFYRKEPKIRVFQKNPAPKNAWYKNGGDSSNPTQKAITKVTEEENKNSIKKQGNKVFSYFTNMNNYKDLQKENTYLINDVIVYPNKNFPESRMNFVFVNEGKNYILNGGFLISKNLRVWKFLPNENTWTPFQIQAENSELRYGHTGILRHKQLYIFGGKYFAGGILGDVEIFNTETGRWTDPNLQTHNKFPLRRHHIAVLVGFMIFVHGGIDEDENYLDDYYLLNIRTLKWTVCTIGDKLKVPKIAYHKACLILQEEFREDPKMHIYKYPDSTSLMNNNIKERGIYLFGGKLGENGPINSNLYCLKIGKKPLEWTILKTTGLAPCPRYSCSMNFYEEGNFLIIHGGKIDDAASDFALNDTYFLDLYSLNWIKVEYFNKYREVPNRCCHEAVIYEQNLYIFGGMNADSFLGSELLILELNSNMKCLEQKEKENYQLGRMSIINKANKALNKKAKETNAPGK